MTSDSKDRWCPNLFTSESVSMGHPDKVADQVSDALLDGLLAHDPKVRVAIETLVAPDLVVVAGEVTTHTEAAKAALAQAEQTIRDAIRRIGYVDTNMGFDYKSCRVMEEIHPQSEDISVGVTEGEGLHREQGAGDQGLMFGFACDETKALMPLPIHLSHRLVERQAMLRESGEIGWLRPDAKSQVTVAYEDGVPAGLHTIVLSTQHSEDVIDRATQQMADEAKCEIIEKIIKPVIEAECPQFAGDDIIFHINPTGRFVKGGPAADCGVTGRKIIVDTYGGRGRHGGGAFSGKDPTKVDRSATYMARYIAKNIVAAGLARQCEVQLAYAIGVAEPVSICAETYGTGEIEPARLEQIIRDVFPLTPHRIIESLRLQRPVYFETARHGHFGRDGDGFTWEKTDQVGALQAAAKVMHAV